MAVTPTGSAAAEGISFLTFVADFFTDPTKFAAMSRESKLSTIRSGINASIDAKDWPAFDKYVAMYRVLSAEVGI